jgi:hypothetical protein
MQFVQRPQKLYDGSQKNDNPGEIYRDISVNTIFRLVDFIAMYFCAIPICCVENLHDYTEVCLLVH